MFNLCPSVLQYGTNLQFESNVFVGTVLGQRRALRVELQNIVKREVAETVGIKKGALIDRVFWINNEFTLYQLCYRVNFVLKVSDYANAEYVGEIVKFSLLVRALQFLPDASL